MNKQLQGVIKVLFLAKSALWMIFGIYYGAQTDSNISYLTSIVLIADAVIFFWIGAMLDKRRWIYYFSIVFLLVNVCFQLFDEIGVVEYFILTSDILIMFLLIFNKENYCE